jgi:ribosomal protein S3AE
MCPAFSTLEFPLLPLATRLLVKVSIWSVLTILTEVAADSLRGRVFDISLGELNSEAHDSAWRKVKVQVEEIKGFDCYTNFHGLDVTRDKLCSLVKKWHSLIEAFV